MMEGKDEGKSGLWVPGGMGWDVFCFRVWECEGR